MRVLGKIVALIAVALLPGTAGQAQCPGVEPFLAKLEAGGTPRGEDFQLGVCNRQKIEPELAKAVASYLKKAESADALNAIQIVKEAHRAAGWVTGFRMLSEGIQEELEGTDLHFVVAAASGDNYALLDPLVETLKMRQKEPIQIASIKTPAEQQIGFLMRRINDQVKVDQDLRRYLDLIGVTLLGLVLASVVVLGYMVIPKLPKQKRKGAPVPVELAHLQSLEQRVVTREATVNDLVRTVGNLKGEIAGDIARQLKQHDEDWNKRLADTLSQTPPPPMPDIEPLRKDVEDLKASFQKEASNGGSERATALLPLERDVLKEAWARFMDNKEVMAVLANARNKNWEQVQDALLVKLPQCIPGDLKPTFDAALAPLRDFDNLMTKIFLVPLVLGEKTSPKPESRELLLLRELTSLLSMIQNSNLLADRLNFRLEPWIADCFLGFADLFLQRHQRAQMENRESQFAPGYEIVRSILKIADLEPVDLTLGVTPFDSARHIGRSTASDPNVASGVILGVIRNGFIRGGQQVIRQPEVIVNRVA